MSDQRIWIHRDRRRPGNGRTEVYTKAANREGAKMAARNGLPNGIRRTQPGGAPMTYPESRIDSARRSPDWVASGEATRALAMAAYQYFSRSRGGKAFGSSPNSRTASLSQRTFLRRAASS